MAVDTRGRVVTRGMSCEFPGNSDEVCDVGLARHASNGTPDRRFGRYGKIRTDLGADVSEGIRGVAVQSDSRIVAAGETIGPGGWDVALTRYRSNGRLDRSFGDNWVVTTPVSRSTDEVGGLTLQADGRSVVAGAAAVSQGSGFFVSRFLGS